MTRDEAIEKVAPTLNAAGKDWRTADAGRLIDALAALGLIEISQKTVNTVDRFAADVVPMKE